MRRRVAICKFNPADYARWEGQEGVGLQGGNTTDLEQKNGGSDYSLPPFLIVFSQHPPGFYLFSPKHTGISAKRNEKYSHNNHSAA